jgi:hypothetical protein
VVYFIIKGWISYNNVFKYYPICQHKLNVYSHHILHDLIRCLHLSLTWVYSTYLFVVYVMALSVAQTVNIHCQSEWCIMKWTGWRRKWPCHTVKDWVSVAGGRVWYREISNSRLSCCWDMNLDSPTYKAVMLNTVPHCSVICVSQKAFSMIMFKEQLYGNKTVAELLWGN